jgi:hypothetical protein
MGFLSHSRQNRNPFGASPVLSVIIFSYYLTLISPVSSLLQNNITGMGIPAISKIDSVEIDIIIFLSCLFLNLCKSRSAIYKCPATCMNSALLQIHVKFLSSILKRSSSRINEGQK